MIIPFVEPARVVPNPCIRGLDYFKTLINDDIVFIYKYPL